eukprot:CAMPEP_0170167874 /NCGR_PEP_ID=MMETSP0040_2-20121228/1145_1 /TAXON_ID=641309 /ORGANISM="Lotharella oceanica, Strain CCMP622" /LENGTH=205 /DNA_ID=CAMNT_0010406021 /DNA_START=41 /DNA_END=658 /DNA_ORIENTATION=+
MDYDYLVKIVMVGDSGVGKTQLVQHFVDEKFVASDKSTIGADLRIKTLDLNDRKIKLQIWDTAGQERFRSITQCYYRGSHAVCLVVDVTNYASCQNVGSWLQDIRRYAPKETKIIMCANKCDYEEDQRAVDLDELQRCFGHDVIIIETSAKEGTRVREAFIKAAEGAVAHVQSLPRKNMEPNRDVVLGPSMSMLGGRKSCPCTIL